HLEVVDIRPKSIKGFYLMNFIFAALECYLRFFLWLHKRPGKNPIKKQNGLARDFLFRCIPIQSGCRLHPNKPEGDGISIPITPAVVLDVFAVINRMD